MKEINPFTLFDKTWALLSAGNSKKSNTMTISWGGLGTLWSRKVAFVFVRDSRYTKEFIDNNETFSVAFLDESYRKSLAFCGSKSGRDFDKWKETGLTPVEKDNTVYPAQAKTVLICKKIALSKLPASCLIDKSIIPEHYTDNDFHTMYVGEVISEINPM